ncbi:hypothetical protein D0T60_01940 [Bacteroides sp. 224]|nr:hypothetical protein [Bacteroides sp. 224]
MQMNENKEMSWSDVEIRIGGRKIYGITNSSINIAGRGKSGILIDNIAHSFTGTVTLSKKNLRRLRKICMAKKMRLPRKLKKKLKKTI